MSDLVLISHLEDSRIALLKLNRPEKRNALSNSLLEALDAAFTNVQQDPVVRVIVIGAQGSEFCAGADIAELRAKESAVEAAGYIKQIQRIYRKMEALDRPVIAAVQGVALGGGFELCLACDLVIAEETARFGLPEVNLGILPGAGGTQRLPRIVGRNRAKAILFSGEPVSAKEMQAAGVVHSVVPHGEAERQAVDLAKKLAEKPPLAIAKLKQLVNQGVQANLETGLQLEIESITTLFGTQDQKEGMSAFLEKRIPHFRGE